MHSLGSLYPQEKKADMTKSNALKLENARKTINWQMKFLRTVTQTPVT